MRKIIFALALIICIFAHAAVDNGENDNIVITQRTKTYTLKSSAGSLLGGIKERDEITFTAQRVNGKALAHTFYYDDIKVDKASAPGAKPQYRKATDKDIFFDDSRVCFMEVPVQAGKEAKAVFELSHTDPTQFCEIHMPCVYFTREYTIQVEVPLDLEQCISIEPMNMPESMRHERLQQAGKGVIYKYTYADLPATKKEALAPSYSLSAPRLVVKGVFYDLDALYKHLHSFCQQDQQPSDPVALLAKSIAGNAPSQAAAIDSVAGWARRNIRYVAIEHGDFGRSPAPAADVLQNRYGDCKGSANLIKEMLRSIGIDARLAWIGTAGEKPYSWSDYPLMSCGNHMIAAAMLPDTTIFIDGTTGLQPRGYLSPSIQGREALIEDGDSYILRRVPTLSASASCDSACAAYDILPGAGLRGRTTRTLSGSFCSMLENSRESISASRRDEFMHAFASPSGASAMVDSVSHFRASLDAPTSELAYSTVDSKGVKQASGSCYVSLPALHDLPVSPFSEKEISERANGIRLPFGWKVCTASTLALPEDAGDVALPENVSFEGKWFRLSIAYSIDGESTVICNATAETISSEAGASDAKAWNDELAKITKLSSRKIKFTKK